jgi:SNF2 family DNA or RNA helicase
MKTIGFKHQIEALQRMNGREYYALFMEAGTGKTFTILTDAERLYAAGKIDAVLVICPNGLQMNWVKREIPIHLEVPHIARAWRSGAGVREKKALDDLMAPRDVGEEIPLRILVMNIEALNTPKGLDFCKRFLRITKCMMAIDESSRIKNPAAARTKKIIALRDLAVVRRIATGTPITKAPVDLFMQMEFLSDGLLGTTSYRSFVSEYAELADMSHPRFKSMIRENPRIAHAQIVERDALGNPIWRNLDKLQKIIQPNSFRVLKKDCMDLPDKIYTTRYFNLDSDQRKTYNELRDELRIDFTALDAGQVLSVTALVAITKLQQITSGFVMVKGMDGPVYISENNARLEALEEIIEDIDGQFLIWARFREEIAAIARLLHASGRTFVEYHGGVSSDDREIAVDSFQRGEVDIFLGQPQSGGIGLTLTAAGTVVYFSQDYNLETRLQSEDRTHRIGTTKKVLYIDLVANDTIDEKISISLQRKSEMATTILDRKQSTYREGSAVK